MCGILRREIPTYTYWRGPPLQRRVVPKWFYSLSRRNTFVGGTCTPPSALLVCRISASININIADGCFYQRPGIIAACQHSFTMLWSIAALLVITSNNSFFVINGSKKLQSLIWNLTIIRISYVGWLTICDDIVMCKYSRKSCQYFVTLIHCLVKFIVWYVVFRSFFLFLYQLWWIKMNIKNVTTSRPSIKVVQQQQ